MDFGLRDRTAIVCAASMGLGRSCAAALAVEGVKVVIVARRREVLERTAAEIRSATGAEIVAVAADVLQRRDATPFSPPVPIQISSSTMPAALRLVISGTGIAMPGSRRWTPICWRRSS